MEDAHEWADKIMKLAEGQERISISHRYVL